MALKPGDVVQMKSDDQKMVIAGPGEKNPTLFLCVWKEKDGSIRREEIEYDVLEKVDAKKQ